MNNIEKITSLIFALNLKIKESFEKSSNDVIFSVVQMRVLYFVNEKKNPSMKEVAEHFCISSPSATETIERLIKLELLTRKSNEEDRRSVNIAITKKGEKELKKAKEVMDNAVCKALSNLNKKDLGSFLEILEKVIN